jgi:lysophospholipase L1-like esterase
MLPTCIIDLNPCKARNYVLTVAFLLFAAPVFCLAQDHWVGTWAAAQQMVEPRNALSPQDAEDMTLRQIVHLSIGGSKLRLRLSNRFGKTPLHLTAVHLALPVSPSSSRIQPTSDKALTFSGATEVTIPAGAEYVSDTVSFSVPPLSDVAITLHTDQPPAEQTGHPGSRATSYFVHGDQVAAPELHGAQTTEHWYYIAGLDVAASPNASATVALGDSITDGHGATTNGNDRWTDVLARRLQTTQQAANIAVLNLGIGGNRLLEDGLGPNAMARLDHDVIAQTGVRTLIVLEGINDIGTLTRQTDAAPAQHQALVQSILSAYKQIILRAHMHNIRVIGATILPFGGSSYYHPTAANEADRQAVNAWIRASGQFDAVVDFDQIMRDPVHPERLLPAYDSGDHLHPSPAGYAAMANSIPLSLLLAPQP